MDIQRLPLTQTFTCHECGYDMHDRQAGDPCPECNTALDSRKDDPVAERKSRIGTGFMIAAILLTPIFGFFATLFVGIAHYQYHQSHSLTSIYRISYSTRKRRKRFKLLFYCWIGEVVTMILILLYWPNAFNWW